MQAHSFLRAALAVCVGFVIDGGSVVPASATPADGNVAAHQQFQRGTEVPVHAPSEALHLGLMTVTSDLPYFAGQYVRIPVVRVYEVISPRVFAVESAGMPSTGFRYYDGRALVFLSTPVTTIRPGDLVEIVGRPWTRVAADARLDRTALAEVNEHLLRYYAHKPFIGADLVRTPDGVQLFAR